MVTMQRRTFTSRQLQSPRLGTVNRVRHKWLRAPATILICSANASASPPALLACPASCDIRRIAANSSRTWMRCLRKPRDKTKVEVAVQVVERWVLARLRHRRFFSLDELNAAIRELIDELNTRTMRRIGCSRRALFKAIERTALLSLPSEPFEYAEWKRWRPGLDYHIEVHGHWYSVPHGLIREVVEARITDRTVEIFHHGVRVAVHARSPISHRHTTSPITCRAHTGATPIGPRADCDVRPLRLVQQPLDWWI